MTWLSAVLLARKGTLDNASRQEAQAREAPWMPQKKVLDLVEKTVFDLALPQQARDYIFNCFQHGPYRRVQSNRGTNTNHCFFSRKMQNQQYLESRKGEWARAALMDADGSDVICFLAQPAPVQLVHKGPDGTARTTAIYHADFLVVRRNSIVVVQQRDLGVLTEDALTRPHEWYRDDAGTWHFRAADEAFEEIGIPHEVSHNDELSPVLIRNERFLQDYTRQGAPRLPEDKKNRLSAFIRERRMCSFYQTMMECELTADEINTAIVDNTVYVNLTEDLVDDTANLVLFSDGPTARAFKLAGGNVAEPPLPLPGSLFIRPGTRVDYEGKSLTVLVSGGKDVLLEDEYGKTQSLSVAAISNLHRLNLLSGDGFVADSDLRQLADYSPRELQDAIARLDAMRDPTKSDYEPDTIARFKKKIAGTRNDLEALLLLIDRSRDRGNHEARVSAENRALGRQAVTEKYNSPEGATKKATYHLYEDLCAQNREKSGAAMRPVSYTRFCQWVDEDKSTSSRKGKRHAYQEAEIPVWLDNSLPVHGVRPHEVCYIDHTPLNLSTKAPNGMALGKPWLSLGRDGNSTNVKALYISYDAPSARAVLMVLRDYVRRNGRLPRILAVDNGKEFHSNELEFFCRIFQMDIRWRPPGQPRGGAPIESLIGASEEEVIAQAKGNTRILKDPRLATKSVNPFNFTEWTLPSIYFAFVYWCFDIRANRIAPALGVTPNEYEQRRLAETGNRNHLLVQLDENMMLLTSPAPKQAFRRIHPRRGVFVDGAWYWHPDLAHVRKRSSVPVRVEPWMYVVVYVQLPEKWVAAVCSDSRRLGHRTRKEVDIVLREERRRSKSAANRDTLSPKNAAKMRRLWDPRNFDPRLSTQQSEMRYLYSMLGMAVAMPLRKDLFLDEKPGDTSPGATPSMEGCVHEVADADSSATPRAPPEGVSGNSQSETKRYDEDSQLPGYH